MCIWIYFQSHHVPKLQFDTGLCNLEQSTRTCVCIRVRILIWSHPLLWLCLKFLIQKKKKKSSTFSGFAGTARVASLTSSSIELYRYIFLFVLLKLICLILYKIGFPELYNNGVDVAMQWSVYWNDRESQHYIQQWSTSVCVPEQLFPI